MRSAKEEGLRTLRDLGLPVPPWIAIGPRDPIPAGLRELSERMEGAPDLGDLVSVRSGAAVSMPGMMDTILGVGSAGLADAVRAVRASWDSPRAVTYRELHEIPHDLGTWVIVQRMVHGDRDDDSYAGVAFSRDPNTGEPELFGEVVRRARGDAVVAGESPTDPLTTLPGHLRDELRSALRATERHYRDVCHVEFTVESGRLWFLQVRSGGLAGAAAVRAAVDLADEGVISRAEAVRRARPSHGRVARTQEVIRTGHGLDVIARGRGASPGVAAGRIAVTSDEAVRMAREGSVVLVRPHTSPLDMHGLAAAAGVVTSQGGPTSHAAVVARSMGKPAVVRAGVLVTPSGVRVNDRFLSAGSVITIDGTSGAVVLGEAPVGRLGSDDHLRRLLEWSTSLDLSSEA
ncbi:PEP/pyruvate-binding domain-containing protein [Actinoplanes sp. NPDC023714]|uniref:PEP/pyruvate-binding domain-containing protein n=1 Tax=Actinoplanes sp. NPDC023714 TaxID=3154322 RepID=UPI0033FD6F0B